MTNEQEIRLEAIKEAIRNHKNTAEIIAECGITIEEKPSILPDRPGYKWVPTQATAKGSITWVEVEDPNAEGTAENPIVFVSGMAVYANYYYTDGTTRYVCVQAGNPTEIAEGEYFTEL